MIRRTFPPFSSTTRTAGVVASLGLGLALLAGCDSAGASTECDLDSCNVTFDRGVDVAQASVLGVDAKLIGADTDAVTVEIAGEQVILSIDQPDVKVAGLYVSLNAVNDSQAVVRIGRNPRS